MVFGSGAIAELGTALARQTCEDEILLRFFPFMSPHFLWLGLRVRLEGLLLECWALGPVSLSVEVGHLPAISAILLHMLSLGI